MRNKLILLMALTIVFSMSFSSYAITETNIVSDPRMNVQDQEAYFDDAGLMDEIDSITDVQKKRMLEDFLCTPAYSFVSHNDTATDMELFHQQFVDALNFVKSVKDLPMKEFTEIVNNKSKKHIENVLSKKDIVISETFIGFAKKYHPEYVEIISSKIKEQPSLENTLIIPTNDNSLNTDASISRFYYMYDTSSNYMSYFPNARLECNINWNWDVATGTITYLAPQTTAWIINNSHYWWDGSVSDYKISQEKVSADGDYGYVNKLKGFYCDTMSYAGKLVPEGLDINVKIYQANVSGDRSQKVSYQSYFSPWSIAWYWE